MDYQEKEDLIVNYVRDKFNSFAPSSDVPPVKYFINEFLDFDKYNYDNALFFQFDDYAYEELTFSSKLETGNMRIFIVSRNDKEQILHERLRRYASSFWNMFEASGYSFAGIVDMGMITGARFFDAVEGNSGIKLCEITLSLSKETI
jgi:hypothetical protein